MATLTNDMSIVRSEFRYLKMIFKKIFNEISILSFGMTADYKIAIEEGSRMVRIGSLIFGERN